MQFEIVLAPQAIEGLKALRPEFQSNVREALETHLRHEPTKVSKSRIKRLRGVNRPQYRLRVREVRVFYDVTETTVEVLAIIPKERAEAWLSEAATPAPPGGSSQGEG
jgi:mRNA interferase RelE/StbE